MTLHSVPPPDDVDDLRRRLEEAEQTLDAIRSGEVDSVVVRGPGGPRVYTLEDSNRSYRVLIEAMNEGAATLSRDGVVTYCNRRFAEMLAQPLEKVIGSALREHVVSEQHDWLNTMLRTAWAATSKGEIALCRSDRAAVRVHLSMSAVVDPEPLLCVVATDLTDQLRLNELRETDRRKDEFLAMLSHELRNPLAPIRNSIYILERSDPASDPARRARDVIKRQSEHLTRIVDDLLDVSRIANGKVELRRARVDLRIVVERAAEDFSAIMRERGIALRTTLPDQALWADVDATRVNQVLGNLLNNAAKFSQHGDEVTVALRREHDLAEVRVSDTGAGIDPTLLPFVFDAFVQGDRTLARSDGGLGLGLALVKGIVALHGGTVRVDSEGVGRGSAFTVTLPLSAVKAVDSAPRRSDGVVGRRRILVVDDNRDAAESLADVLRLLGHEVDVAFDGPSALEMVRESPPDAVLCDVGMPAMNGYMVAQELRKTGRPPMLYAVSGYAQPEDVTRALQAGFDGHLRKPCDLEALERLFGGRTS